MPSQVRQEMTVGAMSIRVFRVETDGSSELFFGSDPVPVEREADPAECHVRFDETVVNLERASRRRSRLWKGLLRRHATDNGEGPEGVSHTCVRQRVRRVEINRLVIERDPFANLRFRLF